MTDTRTDLWRAADELVDTRRVKVDRSVLNDDGTISREWSEYTTVPSLWTQLLGMVTLGQDAAGGGKPGSKPPVALAAMHLKLEIESWVDGAAWRLNQWTADTNASVDVIMLSKLMDRDLRKIVSALNRAGWTDWLDTLTLKLRDWCGRIRSMLDPTAGDRNERRHGIWCVECGTKHVLVPNDDGEECRASPIVFQWRDELLRAAVCEACQHTYWPGEELHRLAENQERKTA